jgi:hypothetical protein
MIYANFSDILHNRNIKCIKTVLQGKKHIFALQLINLL